MWKQRYSQHASHTVLQPAPRSCLTIVDCTMDWWMEPALEHETIGPIPDPNLDLHDDTDQAPRSGGGSVLPQLPFGLAFKVRNKKGEMVDSWPKVARVDRKLKGRSVPAPIGFPIRSDRTPIPSYRI
eukprot:COSAG05_NODE_2929_length_2495_cov_1.626461_2_plen_127_part_00